MKTPYLLYFFLLSTTHHGVQLVLGMYQEGNPFALAETAICDQYTRAEGRFPSRCQFQVLSSGEIPILSKQLTLSHRLLTPNIRVGNLHKCRFKSTVMINVQLLGLDMTSRLIGSGLSDRLSDKVRVKVVCCKTLTTVAEPMTFQSPGYHPNALRITTHSQQVDLLRSYPFAVVQSAYSTAPVVRAGLGGGWWLYFLWPLSMCSHYRWM